MDPLSMEKAMIKNLIDKTGKSIDEWIEIVKIIIKNSMIY